MFITDSATPRDPRKELLLAAIKQAMGRQATQAAPAGYVDPGAREAAVKAAGGDVANSRDAYANKRLDQFRRIAGQVGGDFGAMFGAEHFDDPAAAYRQASGLFSDYAQKQGIADPRQLLQALLVNKNHDEGDVRTDYTNTTTARGIAALQRRSPKQKTMLPDLPMKIADDSTYANYPWVQPGKKVNAYTAYPWMNPMRGN